ncbi:hypothetical protein MARHY0071 [Marinobacter nauticus ATCC 49840]|nr:hypothetical protein MARHY0071 [Marinobacter nauticus ATCC 49840]
MPPLEVCPRTGGFLYSRDGVRKSGRPRIAHETIPTREHADYERVVYQQEQERPDP